MISALFVIYFFTAGLWTVNALRRPVPPGHRFPPLWLPGMLLSELTLVFIAARLLVAWVFVELGALDRDIGFVGLVFLVAGLGGMVVVFSRSVIASRQLGHRPWWLLLPFYERPPEGTMVRANVEYWNGHTLDLMIPAGAVNAPALIYVHPGSWMRGRPGRQARPMLHRLIERGWVILDIRYPLSPVATFPEHLIGVKAAVAWAKRQAEELGIDRDRVAISGASSGAHLAALAALTPDRDDLTPGFETISQDLLACVPFYGIYDLLVRNPTRYDWPFVARYVMKATPSEAPDLYELGSPIDQVTSAAPPFLVVHGEFDSIVLAAESRHFVEALRSTGADVGYCEVRWAQHGFDAVSSLRARSVGALCSDWLEQRAQATREG